MTDLDKLTLLMSEDGQRGARLGYVLGYLHADNEQPCDLGPGAPEFRVLEELRLGGLR